MRVTRPAQVFLAAAALAAAGVAGGAVSASAETSAPAKHSATTTAKAKHAKAKTPSYKQFKRHAFRDVDGQWIVNGDEPVSNKRELRAYYHQMVSSKDGWATGRHFQSLIVNTVGGADDVWSSSELSNLTYCVSDDFSDKAGVVSAMASGSALWENASSAIDFVYDSSQDADCNTGNDNVVFSVEPVVTSDYIARSFFPSSPKSERNILVDEDALVSSGSWTPGNILGHEEGHILGFRHEHTRPEAGTCFEDDNWRALTPYDDVSIMHYPQCNGGSDDLTFSSLDTEGVQALYGS
jgi:hypothetical protein